QPSGALPRSTMSGTSGLPAGSVCRGAPWVSACSPAEKKGVNLRSHSPVAASQRPTESRLELSSPAAQKKRFPFAWPRNDLALDSHLGALPSPQAPTYFSKNPDRPPRGSAELRSIANFPSLRARKGAASQRQISEDFTAAASQGERWS